MNCQPIAENTESGSIVTGKRCSKVVGMSGEYQFAGPALRGWPHNSANPTNSNGQSPGLTGSSITLGGHAGLGMLRLCTVGSGTAPTPSGAGDRAPKRVLLEITREKITSWDHSKLGDR